jgi:hypothetical protein
VIQTRFGLPTLPGYPPLSLGKAVLREEKSVVLTLSLYNRQPPPAGWVEYTHLNGVVYYYNSEQRIVTPHDVKKPDILQAVLAALNNHLTRVRNLRTWPESETQWPRCVDNLKILEHVVFDIDRKAKPGVYHVSYPHQRKIDFDDGCMSVSFCS